MSDKYTAVWVSHSSMGDFVSCPRSYYLKNMYKNPKTGKKLGIVSPALSLGSAVHEVVEGLAQYPSESRFDNPQELLQRFEKTWKKFEGKLGGFKTQEEEHIAKTRGLAMIQRVIDNPDPLKDKIVKLPEGAMLPHYYLSEQDNIILCGRIDWLRYQATDDSIHIIDFKTGKHEEKESSLQLPIYQLLLDNLQKRKVTGASYWYLDSDDSPKEVNLPDIKESFDKVYVIAKKVSDARSQAKRDGIETVFACPRGTEGCFNCMPFEKIIAGKAEFVGNGEWGQEMYIV